MAKEFKQGKISFAGADPMVLSEVPGLHDLEDPTEEQKAVFDAVGNTVVAYMRAAKDLLEGKLTHLKGWAPPHLANPGNVLVACCSEGIVIRYETKSENPQRTIAGWMPYSLTETASMLSQKLLRIRRDPADSPPTGDFGTELRFFKTSAETGESTVLATARIVFETTLTSSGATSTAPSKPFCLLSIRNSLEVQLLGEIVPTDPTQRPRQPFLARSLLRLPVGWDCIEVFPGIATARWKPAYAPAWVETDILAAVVSHQFHEAQLNSLDPNTEARRRMAAILEEYKQLLDSEPQQEEVLQRFLTANPVLLCPAHIRVWPKLALGAHVTDFVFQEAAGDYLLVELEKSIEPLFIKSGHPSHQLTRARGQVQDWRRYLEDNLSTVQRELGLHGISPSPRCLIVIGRAKSLSQENRRKLMVIENEAPSLKVLTYDDVLENAKAVVENLLGPLWNVQGNTHIYYLPAGSAGARPN